MNLSQANYFHGDKKAPVGSRRSFDLAVGAKLLGQIVKIILYF
jgi:hypothetical protein